MENSLLEHREILNRIELHDPEGAKVAIAQHLDRSLRDILKLREQGFLFHHRL